MVIKTVIVTFCCTWFMWGCIILANQFGYLGDGTPLNMVLFIIGCLSPVIVAVTFILKDKVMLTKQLLKIIFEIKQPLVSYLIIIGFMVLFVAAGTISGMFNLFSPIYLMMLPVMVVVGGLEEVCWRFVLQPSLEKKLPFAIATSITAIVWSIWHLPLFFIKGKLQYNWNFGLYVILLFGLAFALAAIYRLTKSVWLCVLFHAFVNTLFEDGSLSAKLHNFNEDFVSVIITSAVLIVVSCFTVRIAKNIPKRRTE